MAFVTTKIQANDNQKSQNINFEELNKYVVETAGLQEREVLVGYIAGIVDLGEQNSPDSEYPFDGTPDDENEEINKNSSVYFKDGIDERTKKPVRLKCKPESPRQAVAFAVEFPEIILDKSKFFGTSSPAPLRLWTGGTFHDGTSMIVARPTYLKINKSLGGWSFDAKHLCYKLATASKLIKPGEFFMPENIDQLLGQSFQWQAQVFMKPGKNGKEYFTEYLQLNGALGRGQTPAEPVNPPFLIQFNDTSLTKDSIRQLRGHIINTMKKANNYEGSHIQKLIEGKEDTNPAQAGAPSQPKPAATSAPKRKAAGVDDDVDTDCPF